MPLLPPVSYACCNSILRNSKNRWTKVVIANTTTSIKNSKENTDERIHEYKCIDMDVNVNKQSDGNSQMMR